MAGQLFLVATPIGNLEDLSARALRTLETVDYIAAEDTRHTLKLLNHFGIKKEMTSYHEHNQVEKGEKILQDLLEGKQVALVSDAGTPGISDPGELLVRSCHQAGVDVTAIPGPAALILGLVLSGLSTRRFVFEGFLPVQKKARQKILESLEDETRTVLFYEAPHKLRTTLQDMHQVLGNRKIVLARELTKKFEEVVSMDLEGAIHKYAMEDPRGEYVLVLEGQSESSLEARELARWEEMSLEEHLVYYEERGMDRKEAIKQVAKDRKLPKREVYGHFHR
ncbi:16S rRNA (cytidine(1402)-2'-O)-methyltransferase [Anaerotalea alkaliphila]|uniref:Ribosomal RNA small subunit methyltransferase I n=1 Tax=Anaerotalea alkaliphila TaxID=2662126 RepID=A0A7X5HW30_9FIRM|nr:16S rRNA (cytidine(1402)-2'-O)-methyltransferase [Anaerotalea alkaliphila]NDL67730.1 16S rRNA (cytidine(1402)-2'-O)-methyltransferase [Anaerotalea alkaliphila]